MVLLPGGETVVGTTRRWLGTQATNNQAEYDALIAGLDLARRMKHISRVRVEGGMLDWRAVSGGIEQGPAWC